MNVWAMPKYTHIILAVTPVSECVSNVFRLEIAIAQKYRDWRYCISNIQLKLFQIDFSQQFKLGKPL